VILELDYVHVSRRTAAERWLAERHPELHGVFEADQGRRGAVAPAQRKKRADELARLVRAAAKSDDGLAETASGGAADVGCLVGEMHLSRGSTRGPSRRSRARWWCRRRRTLSREGEGVSRASGAGRTAGSRIINEIV